MTVDLAACVAGWAPAPVVASDPMEAAPIHRLSAVLGPDLVAVAETGTVPTMWHWLYFLDWPPGAELGADGHPSSGPFLPPVPDRRRMWAGGRLVVHRPLRLAAPATRTSTLLAAVPKDGRSGPLLLVTVRYDVHQDGVLVLREEQDHVYRSGAGRTDWSRADGAPDADGAPWQVVVPTDVRTLFALSALTANSHRIHYDAPYATEVEGYPGLVVHGPLLVLAMVGLVARETGRAPTRVDYRLTEPAFAGDHVLAVGGPGRPLRVVGGAGRTHATATVGDSEA